MPSKRVYASHVKRKHLFFVDETPVHLTDAELARYWKLEKQSNKCERIAFLRTVQRKETGAGTRVRLAFAKRACIDDIMLLTQYISSSFDRQSNRILNESPQILELTDFYLKVKLALARYDLLDGSYAVLVIRYVEVYPDFRSQGYFRTFLNACEKIVRKCGLDGVYIAHPFINAWMNQTGGYGPRFRAFFRRRGYEDCGCGALARIFRRRQPCRSNSV